MVSLNFVLLFYNGLHQRVWTHVSPFLHATVDEAGTQQLVEEMRRGVRSAIAATPTTGLLSTARTDHLCVGQLRGELYARRVLYVFGWGELWPQHILQIFPGGATGWPARHTTCSERVIGSGCLPDSSHHHCLCRRASFTLPLFAGS